MEAATLPETAVVWGLRVAYAALILGVGLWLAFFVSGVVRRQAIKNPRIDTTLGSFIGLVIRYGIIVFVLIAVLQKFGVQTASLVAVLGAGALAVGLALQGTLGNLASGLIIILMRPYHIGDFVEINGKEGHVVDIDLLFSQIRTLEDRRVFVPNGQALANPIVNHSTQGQVRVDLVFGVGYDDDLDQVFAVMGEVMGQDARALSTPPPWFAVTGLGDFAVNVSGRVWVKPEHLLDYRTDMLKAVKEAFDREGIDLPYPHAVEMSKGEIAQRSAPIKPPLPVGGTAQAAAPGVRHTAP